MQSALAGGGGGFMGSRHLVKRLKKRWFWVRRVDLNYPECFQTVADALTELRGRSSTSESSQYRQVGYNRGEGRV